ncbi:MAG TPA: MFS transporter [Rhabdochlamydiaceae bacterium]|nr:MFS transporter [Rhabdochlamydiaceae bacterium]
MTLRSKRTSFLILPTLYTIYFLDLAALAVVLVIFAPLIIDGDTFLPPDVTKGTRNVILGLLLATYPITQFFGAPLLGEISDRFGRKWPLFISALFTALTSFLSAIALGIGSLWLLFLSRFLAGFCAGNMTITQASASDIIEVSKRPQYMALFNIMGGVAWTIAPFGGSILISNFSYAAPFWALGGLFLISALIVLWKFEEKAEKGSGHLNVGRIFKDLLKTLEMPKVAPLLLISILTIFGWLLYQAFMSPYLVQKYAFSEGWVGKSFTYFSAWWLIGGLLANQWLLKKYDSKRVNFIPMLLAPLAVFSFLFFSRSLGMWYASAIANIAASIASSCFFALFSVMAPHNVQGKVFGFWNAGFALASAIAPILSGVLAVYNINFPFLAAALVLFLSFLLYCRWVQNVAKAA